jgi:hypothetical protein
MRNGAYSFAFLALIGGLVLLMIAEQDDVLTPLGIILLLLSLLLAGIGKMIDVLGYVREGATDPDDRG